MRPVQLCATRHSGPHASALLHAANLTTLPCTDRLRDCGCENLRDAPGTGSGTKTIESADARGLRPARRLHVALAGSIRLSVCLSGQSQKSCLVFAFGGAGAFAMEL